VKQETRLELVIEHLKDELKQVKLRIAFLEESAQSARNLVSAHHVDSSCHRDLNESARSNCDAIF
jgi:hypothetical protein